jgi:hypothetical protein
MCAAGKIPFRTYIVDRLGVDKDIARLAVDEAIAERFIFQLDGDDLPADLRLKRKGGQEPARLNPADASPE